MKIRSRALASVAIVAMIAGAAAPAWAETLQDAIALAYQTNPTLLAQRANQRALDETVVQARSGLRPTLSAGVSATYSRTDGPDSPAEEGFDLNGDGDFDDAFEREPVPASEGIVHSRTGSVSLNLSQNLWTAGRVALGIDSAQAGVLQGRETLREVEQQVLVSVISAYVSVVRDMDILRIRQENLGVLQRQLEEASARFEVGEITRTDVAQAEARLAQSEADLSSAQAQLSTSRATYAAVIGQAPGTLEAAPALPIVPTDFDDALDIALAENPGLLAAGYNLRGAELAVASARAEYRPSARITSSFGGSDSLRSFTLEDNNNFTTTASVSIPLFTGGLNASRVAQALEQANAAQIGVEGERRSVLQTVSAYYAQVISSRATVQAGEEAVRAATVAAEGVRQEAQVGLRTTLDVLNQELELRSAQVTLASARASQYVSTAQLLASMGRLEGPALSPSIERYDPEANFNRVRNRGALPWDGVVEGLDRVLSPAVVPANDAADAPIDTQLKGEVIQTAPRD